MINLAWQNCSSRTLHDAMSLLDDQIDSNSVVAQPRSDSTNYYLPLIFRPEYDIKFWGLEKLHPFDTRKWGRVANFVRDSLQVKWALEHREAIHFVAPNHSITDQELLLVHDERFVHNVRHSKRTLVGTSEVCLLYILPMRFIQWKLIRPLRYQTMGIHDDFLNILLELITPELQGTMLACLIALKFNFAINIGGGFHHCSARRSGGFCLFADITLAMRYVWNYCILQSLPIANILIVDCDAHQGNGYQRDVLMMTREEKKYVYIADFYHQDIYPRDESVKLSIDREVILPPMVEDDEYLEMLRYHLNATLEVDKFKAKFIIFNAGTDILLGDRLGRLGISPNGIIQRDEIVFSFAKKHNIPIMMLLSGGYQRSNARVIADSILNLIEANLIKPINIVHM